MMAPQKKMKRTVPVPVQLDGTNMNTCPTHTCARIIIIDGEDDKKKDDMLL